jgi:hypothetical protein
LADLLIAGVEADEALRAEARAWFEASWDPDLTLDAWWDR